MRRGQGLPLPGKGGGMMGWIEGDGFLWIKAIHAIFVIFWMAGMFMLPRYFAYHSECAIGSAESETWKLRERRILRIIVNPAMIVAWICGILMIVARPEYLSGQYWLHAKLTLVLLLSGFHGFLAGQRRKFARDEGLRNSPIWRMLNEIPSFTIIAVVILVIVKPF
jgi:putative membrane protein